MSTEIPQKVVVEKVYHFGVFVRMEDNRRGYIRCRELTLSGDINPNSFVRPGDELFAKVVVPASGGYVAELSVRACVPEPWKKYLREHHLGEVVLGTIKQVYRDHAIIQILPGVNGYLYSDEVYPEGVQDLNTIFWKDDHVEAMIIRLDPKNKQIYLSIRRRQEQIDDINRLIEKKDKSRIVLERSSKGGSQSPAGMEEYQEGFSFPNSILVIEENENVRKSLLEWLVSHNCKAEGCESIKYALDLLEQKSYSLVLLSLDMDEDNAGLIEQLREKSGEIPLAVIGMPETIETHLYELPKLRALTAFEKPLNLRQLRDFLVQLSIGNVVGLPPYSEIARGLVDNKSISTLLEITDSDRRSFEERIQTILNEMISTTRAEGAAVFHLDNLAHKISLLVKSGSIATFPEAIPGLVTSPIKDVLEDNQPLFESHAMSKDRQSKYYHLLNFLEFESCIGVPIQVGGEVNYSCFIFHSEPSAFSSHHVREVGIYSTLIRVLLENNEFNLKVRSLSGILLSGQLAGSFSHELNNNITRLNIHVDKLNTIILRLNKDLSSININIDHIGIEGDLRKTIDAVSSLSDNLNNFQQLMRIQEEGATFVNMVVRQAASQLNLEANKARVVISLDLAKDLPTLNVNSLGLYQVVLNLMLNAIQQMKEMPDRKHRLNVSTRQILEKTGMNVLQIRITDNGPGIHKHLWEKIFSLGFTTRTGGSGLGLFISRNIIEAMHARLVVEESQLLLGTTFLIEFSFQ